MNSPQRISLLFLSLTVLVVSFVYFPLYLKQRKATAELTTILSEQPQENISLDARVKSADCILNGSLPDHSCSPGAIFPDAGLDEICTPGYTKTVRSVSLKLRKSIFAEYGVAYPPPKNTYEVDHIIPLELGGNNDLANLFPEAALTPGFKEKDIVEDYLNQEVCAGRASLKMAQWQIASDWLAIYNRLTPYDIERIKSKFGTWAE